MAHNPSQYSGVLPAGKYVISDPCYLVGDETWQRLIEETDCFNIKGEGPCVWTDSVTGKQFTAIGTAYGDGVYEDNYGGSYPVDAGLIGAVPLEMVELLDGEEFVEFDEPFEVGYDDGAIYFGHIRIQTDWDKMDIEEDDEEEE